MVLANSNDKADYAVIRLRQHGNDTCLYKTYLAVNSSVEVTFRCPGLTLGEFEWTTYWSAAKPELARLARVIDQNSGTTQGKCTVDFDANV